MGKIWQLEDIDPDDPEQRFLPVLQYIPVGFGTDAGGRNRIVLPEALARAISKHLTECGVPRSTRAGGEEAPRPYRGEQSPLNPLGDWVSIDEPDPPKVRLQDPAAMTPPERTALVEKLRYMGYRINEPLAPKPVAQVIDAIDDPPRFDPHTHSVTEVNAYLRDLDDDEVEKRRVLYQEKRGQARRGILKRWEGA
ncbi:hypothetical protein CRM89_00015 [Nocardia sp. FDAARGOS_372]|uniref:phage gene 29 protein family protein n=1 Tax=Nocardia sp. FDAARGOS_372 TaxID=2018066 RepID=UPI000BF0B654|nr:DUF2744 domain-containing protein [Nocardia sp. FDAARGOS_372]PEH74578.1 hypothetical protein CRM89_00015 [Nocardia sp. FDAARGOS_372]